MTSINPYGRGTVKTRTDFYGFEEQMKKVESFLEQSLKSDSKNICFIGDPSAGKTSFLNICEESSREKGIHSCWVNVNVSTSPFEFFDILFRDILNSLIKKLDSKSFGSMKKDYLTISRGGDATTNCDLDFPLVYHDWKFRKKPKDEYPDSATVQNDLCTIFDSYDLELSSNNLQDDCRKIGLFIDDFQNIIGFDEKTGSVKDESNIERSIKNADSICEVLRTIIERHPDKFIFFIGTYPGLVKNPFELSRKLVKRCFEKIYVDQFNDEKETKELILGCLDKLGEKHPWYQIIRNQDATMLQESFIERFGEGSHLEAIQSILLKNNIKTLVDRVHRDSQGRPFVIKLEMSEIFRNFEEPTDDWRLIRFDSVNKWQRIYKAVSNMFKDNPFYDIIEGYSLETKFHLYLFINNRRLDIDEIIAYLKFHIACHNTSLFDKKNISLQNITDKEIANEEYIFSDELIDLRDISNEKLQNSLKRFIDDEIIEYEDLQKVHYRDNLRILDSNYIRYHLDSLGFPNIRSNSELIYSKFEKFNETILLGKVLTQRNIITHRPGISVEEEINYLKEFLCDPLTIDSFPEDTIPDNLIASIFNNDMYCSIRLMTLQVSSEDKSKIVSEIFFLYSWDMKEPKESNSSYYPVAPKEDLLKKKIYERIISFEETNTGYVFNFEEYGSFELDFRQKLDFANYLEKKGKYVKLVKTFKDNIYLYYWQIGEIDLALAAEDNKISDLIAEDDNIEGIYNEISNRAYLSLCLNDKKRAHACLNKYKDYITKPTVKAALPMYNFTMLRVFLGKIAPQNLVTLMNEFLDNDELLIESKNNIITCLVLFGDDEASLVEVRGLSPFESLFVSIKSLIKNGEKINLTKITHEKMMKEFLPIQKGDKSYYENLDKHLPGIEKLIKEKV